MKKHFNSARATVTAISIAFALLSLHGCGTTTVSKDVSDEGKPGTVVFPDIQKSAWLKEGTFPNLDNLRRIAPGVSKDQLYDLAGRPHFSEGLSSVREWDYIFNFRTGKGAEFITCQYKVVFDKNMTARSFYWQPAACADQIASKAVAPMPAPERVVERIIEKPAPKPAMPSRITLSGDVLFAFDRSGPTDLLQGGQKELDRVAGELKSAGKIERLAVIGYTDRLGSDAYNQQLSEARAETVRGYLAKHGISIDVITASGRGARDPVVACKQSVPTELIACLAPNRRVELVASVSTKP